MKNAIIVLFLISQIILICKGQKCTLTAADIEGPYYQPGAPTRDGIVCYNSPTEDRLVISGTVFDSDCQTPLANTALDIWHASPTGIYSEGKNLGSYDYSCRAVINTDPYGNYQFVSLMPGRYDSGGYRPGHVHFKVTPAGGSYKTLTTQLYFKNDPYTYPNDSCTECNSKSPSLVIPLQHLTDVKSYVGVWNIVMSKGSINTIDVEKPTNIVKGNYMQKEAHIQPGSFVKKNTGFVGYTVIGTACFSVGTLLGVIFMILKRRKDKRQAQVLP